MSLWMKKIAPLFRKLKSCSDEQLMLLAIKGFEHAFGRNRLLFLQAAPRKELKVVKAAWNQIRRAYRTGKDHDKLAALMEVIRNSTDGESGVPGWDETVYALYEIATYHKYQRHAKRYAQGSLRWSYGSVFQPELNDLMITQTGFIGNAILNAIFEGEKSLKACHEEIEFQKGLIDQLIKGKKLSL